MVLVGRIYSGRPSHAWHHHALLGVATKTSPIRIPEWEQPRRRSRPGDEAKPSGFCLISSVDESDQRNAAGLNQPPIDGVEGNPVHLGDHPRAVRVDGLHVCDVAVTALPGDHDRARPRSPSGREAHGLGVSVPRPRVTLPGDLPAGGGRRRGAARGGTGFPPRPDGWDRAADPAATPPENDGATPTL